MPEQAQTLDAESEDALRPNRLSREAAMNLVWNEPIRTVARRYGISDVALAKVCRRHGIPLPPRGFWARARSGRAVSRPSLPPRGPGMPRVVDIRARARYRGCDAPGDLISAVIPPFREFAEPVDELTDRVRRLVGRVTFVRDFSTVHPTIRRLLDADEAVRPPMGSNASHWTLNRMLFESPYDRRRLMIANSVLLALARVGMKPRVQGQDPADFSVGVGETWVSFSLDAPKVNRSGYRVEADRRRPASKCLVLEIKWHERASEGLRLTWQESPGDPLERHLADIVVHLIVAGEVRYRLHEAREHQSLVDRKARLIEEARLRKEAQEREALEQERREERARVRRLLLEASALRQAQDIRSYVEAVRGRLTGGDLPVSIEDLERWTRWALAEADRIDPVLSSAFLSESAGPSNEERSS